MNFIFVCRQTGQVFETGDFNIIENQGVKQDEDGNKYLDARVELTSQCPFCGMKHVYEAKELVCPFDK